MPANLAYEGDDQIRTGVVGLGTDPVYEARSDSRYQVEVLIGPCAEDEADALAQEIAEMSSVRAVGGCVSLKWVGSVSIITGPSDGP